MSEPKPGSARFVPTQPRAVCRLSPSRFPSAKEIFIRAHHHTDGVKQVEKENHLPEQSHLHGHFYDFAQMSANRCHHTQGIEIRVAEKIQYPRRHPHGAVGLKYKEG